MGCEGEMRPAAETIDPDNCIISCYRSTSCVHIKHLHTHSLGRADPLTPLEQREDSNGGNDFRVTRAFPVSPVRLSGFLVISNLWFNTTQLSMINVLKRGKDNSKDGPATSQLM